MIKYLSLFSGIGAFEKALQRLKVPYELVGYCEIDKYASKAYSLLHNVPESMNFGDITQLDEKQLPTTIPFLTFQMATFAILHHTSFSHNLSPIYFW